MQQIPRFPGQWALVYINHPGGLEFRSGVDEAMYIIFRNQADINTFNRSCISGGQHNLSVALYKC